MYRLRGLGTDVALITSMTFQVQILLNMSMGIIIDSFRSTVVFMVACSVLALTAAMVSLLVVFQDI